jgi:LacI family transcriptional regulator
MNAAKQKIDLRDVARLAGVSLGSASRAMNGAGASAATQEKVNHAARVLRSRLSRTVGCLLPDISNPLYAQVFRALEDEFLRHDYLLLLANGANDVDRETKALGTFTQRGMDGVILAPGNERNAALVEALRVLPMPAVVFDREVSGAHDAVLIDHAGGVRRVVEHLLGLRHRDIALVLWQGDTRPVRRRVQGFRTAFQAAGLPVPDLLVQARSVTASVKAEVTELLARPDRPTALIVQGTHMLNSALRAIAARGLQVPRDISVVAIGDTPFAAEHDPAVSVLDIDQAETARCLVDLLLTRIADNNLPQRKARVGLRYVERDSVAAPPRYP